MRQRDLGASPSLIHLPRRDVLAVLMQHQRVRSERELSVHRFQKERRVRLRKDRELGLRACLKEQMRRLGGSAGRLA